MPTESERETARALFDEIARLEWRERTDWNRVARLDAREELVRRFDKLLDETYEAGVISGRAQAGELVFC